MQDIKFIEFLVVGMVLNACGSRPVTEPSTLNWVTGHSELHAILDDNDFADEFLYHASVVGAPSFHKDAILFHSPVQVVRLRPIETEQGLNIAVVSQDPEKTWISYAATKTADGKVEVDFSQMGMEFSNSGASQMFTSIKVPGSPDSAWKTFGRGKLLALQQDADTIVADVAHPVTTLRKVESGGYAVGALQGEIKIRLMLLRTPAVPETNPDLTVMSAREKSFGFYAANRRGLQLKHQDDPGTLAAALELSPINRLALPQDGSVTVYLKDFPGTYFASARDAVLAWNQAFGREALKVEPAPAHVDHGDPRYHVIKWMDDLDESVSWAGAAKFIEDPRSGTILNVDIVVNGSFLANGLAAVHAETQSLASRIGDLPLLPAVGEVPELPFTIGQKRADHNTYLQRTYAATITHELGHSIGLKHNFAASTDGDPTGLGTSSIMDYFPRPLRDIGPTVGPYDKAAIRWAYQGVEPERAFAYCDDEEVATEVFCNQEDWGDPYTYIPTTLSNSLRVVAQVPMTGALSWRGPIYTQLRNALKMLALDYLLPSDRHDQIVQDINLALTEIETAQPASGLSPEDQAAVEKNIQWLKRTLSDLREL